VKQNSLIIEQKGDEDYIVEVTFNDQGIQSSIVIKNDNDRVLYEIVQDNSDVVLLVSLGIIPITLAGIIIVILKKKNNFKQ
jgi:hypothetical protein